MADDSNAPTTPDVRKRKDRESTPSPPQSTGLMVRISSLFKRRRTSVTPTRVAAYKVNGDVAAAVGAVGADADVNASTSPSISLKEVNFQRRLDRPLSQSPKGDGNGNGNGNATFRSPNGNGSSSSSGHVNALPNVANFSNGMSDTPKSVLRKPVGAAGRINPKHARTSFHSTTFSKYSSRTASTPVVARKATPYKTQKLSFRNTREGTSTGRAYKTTPYKTQSVGFATASLSSSTSLSSTPSKPSSSAPKRTYALTPGLKRSSHKKSLLLTGGAGGGAFRNKRRGTPYKSNSLRSQRNAECGRKIMEEVSKLAQWDGSGDTNSYNGDGGGYGNHKPFQFGPPKARLSLNQSVTPGGRLGSQRLNQSEVVSVRRQAMNGNGTFEGNVTPGKDYWNRAETVEQREASTNTSDNGGSMGTLVMHKAVEEEEVKQPLKRARFDPASAPNKELEARPSPTKKQQPMGFGIVGSPTPQKGNVDYIEQEASCLPRRGDGSVLFPSEDVFGVILDYEKLLGPSSTGQMKTELTDSIVRGSCTPNKEKKQNFNPHPLTHESPAVKKKLPFSFMPEKETVEPATASKAYTSLKKELNQTPSSSSKAPAAGSGWGNMFAMKSGEWKCEVCSVRNPKDVGVCQSCGSEKGKIADFTGASMKKAGGASGFNFGETTGGLDKIAPASGAASGISFGFTAPSASNGDAKPSSGGFSFGAPAPDNKEDTKPSTGGFSFGAAPVAKTDTKPSTGGFSFGAAPVAKTDTKPSTGGFSFGAAPAAPVAKSDTDVAKPASSGGFSFGAAPKSNEVDGAKPSTGGFSFGAAPPATAPVAKSNNDVAKKVPAGISFGATPAVPVAASTSAPPQSDQKTETKVGFSFGASTPSAHQESKPSTGGFTFGAASSANTEITEGAKKSTGAFSFGSSTTDEKQGSKRTFGATTTTEKPAASSTSFSFGSAPSTKVAETPAASFQFGSSAALSTGTEATAAAFAFGSQSTGETPKKKKRSADESSSGGSSFTFGSSNQQSSAAPSLSASASSNSFQFGAAPAAPAFGAAPVPTTNAFGASQTSAQPITAPNFGSAIQTPSFGSIQTPAAPTPAAPTFGMAAPSAIAPIPAFGFGGAPTPAAPAMSFGAPTPQPVQPAPGGFGFGAAPIAPALPTPVAPSGFGAPMAPAGFGGGGGGGAGGFSLGVGGPKRGRGGKMRGRRIVRAKRPGT